MRGVLGVEGVAGDHRVEVRLTTVLLRAQQPSEPLGLFLSRPERARHLHRDRRLRQVDREVRDLRHDEDLELTVAEAVEQHLAFLAARRTLDDRGIEGLTELVELVEVGTDDESGGVGVTREDRFDHCVLGACRRTQLVAFLRLGHRVRHPLGVGERHTHLHTVGRGDPTCASMSFHGASYRLGPMSENTSPSRPSSRTSVAVRPRRRRDCRSAVIRKTGAGSRCTSS